MTDVRKLCAILLALAFGGSCSGEHEAPIPAAVEPGVRESAAPAPPAPAPRKCSLQDEDVQKILKEYGADREFAP